MALNCVSSSSSSLHFLLNRSSFPPASPHAARVSSGRLQSLSVRCVGGSPGSRPPVPNNINYMVPLDGSSSSSHPSFITRPLVEILRDLNKRVPDNILKPLIPEDQPSSSAPSASIPWYHANRMLSFYAPGWCGEVRDVIYSDNGSVTVVYRVTIRGSDGEAHRESTGTVSGINDSFTDPVAAAEEIAFCRACARFGLGLYLYHEE